MTPRPVAEVCTDALPAACRQCSSPAWRPCECQPGVHAGRLTAAHRLHLIGDTDLMNVLGSLGLFTPATVVRADAAVTSWT